ncbi:MAG: hypothetical protein ABSH22_00320 [Tepidisphaeraceae bacterium]|jgi:hypothetical protein
MREHFIAAALTTLMILSLASAANAQSTAPDANAADLYARAISLLKEDDTVPDSAVNAEYPPSSPQWHALAATQWTAEAQARDLVHQARSMPTATWPSDLAFYNTVRPLAVHMTAAAIYTHLQGNDAQAIDLFRDINHMGDLLVDSPTKRVTPLIVGIGIQALAVYRLNIITSAVVLTNDPHNVHDLQVRTAKELIEELLDRPEPIDVLRQAMGGESSPQWRDIVSQRQRLIANIQLITVEQQLAAMSLACHVFKFEKGRWPNSLDELIPDDLPRPILDPWGDGSQTLGYALIKGGLPDGSDRPLVYDRQNSADGLCYFPNRVEFGVYTQEDGSTRPISELKHYGQFRDVTRWEPLKNFTGATALPIPQ